MPLNADPTQNSSQRGFSLQKYLLLHSQQDALQKQIEGIFTAYSNSRASSSLSDHSVSKKSAPTSNPPPNPYTHSHLRTRKNSQTLGGTHSRPSSSLSNISSSSSSSSDSSSNAEKGRLSSQTSTSSSSPTSSLSPTLTSFPDPSTLQLLSIEQSKLKDVNLEIRTTLVEMLNSEGSNSDPRFRNWVQSRLMDVEKELRDGRVMVLGFDSI